MTDFYEYTPCHPLWLLINAEAAIAEAKIIGEWPGRAA